MPPVRQAGERVGAGEAFELGVRAGEFGNPTGISQLQQERPVGKDRHGPPRYHGRGHTAGEEQKSRECAGNADVGMRELE